MIAKTESKWFSVVPLPIRDESWCTVLKIERIKPDPNRWTAELTFTPIAFDPDYWFNRSEGFLVDSPEGAVGVVDEVVRTANGDVALLAVVGGWFGRRRYLIHTRDVEEIRPGPQRLLVRAAAAPPEQGRRRRRFPFNLRERATSQLEEQEPGPMSEHRSVELSAEHEVFHLLGIDRGR
jgi:hypothetical protein